MISMRNLTIPVIGLAFTASVCSGAADGEKLLKNAAECSLKIAFRSTAKTAQCLPDESIVTYGKTGRLRIEYHANQDRRKHYRLVDAPPTAYQMIWTEKNRLRPIRMEFHSDWSWWPVVSAMAEESKLREGNYSVSEVVHRGRKCYKLVAKYPSDNATLCRTSPWLFQYKTVSGLFGGDANIRSRKFTSDEFQANQAALRQAGFSVIELIIDANPARPFIYGLTAYNPEGRQLEVFDWGDVEFPENLDEALFLPPPGARVEKAATPQDFSRLYIELNGTGAVSSKRIL